jgi:hypothetical protein
MLAVASSHPFTDRRSAQSVKAAFPSAFAIACARDAPAEQRAIIRQFWRDTEWPRATLDMVLADAGMVFDDLVWETLD